jgi:hypothetical protein
MRRTALAALLLFLLAATAGAAETLEVTTDGARIREDHLPSAPVVVSVKAGTILTVLDTEGDWYKVKTPAGQKGWISKSVVRKPGSAPMTTAPAPTPTPQQESGSWKGTGLAIKRGFTAERKSEVTAAAGARGLDEGGGGGGGKSDMAAVKKMESWTPSKDEIRAFIREGKLSPERLP